MSELRRGIETAGADEEAKRLTDLTIKMLQSMYGPMWVWNVSVDEISKVDNKIRIKGVYSAEFKPTHWFTFEMTLDAEYHLINFKRILLEKVS